ncbi:prion-like-(Q/N-rich) domain-bearing protein 25 isoform X1 [Ostrea edulis]|uniref:prion-like-(Q/N-rich) domain-bearing protein 25 isoform X1 n=1 Tax=Ostrea edulis TaxID=37623 RepID=UPI0024AF771B|nr:prion-like-(Q/N-rich) domain-bearing protein 25 isoform X1 [Ostrea edulis]
MPCTQTTKCKNRICHCEKGFKVIGGTCLPVGMFLNESCSHDRQCTGTVNAGRCQQNNQSLGGGVCSCDVGFFQEGSSCLQGNRRLFQSCESHRQCTETFGARECKFIAGIQMCHCQDNHTVVRDVCVKAGSVIGESCTIDNECTGTKNGGRCVYSKDNGTEFQTCACDEGFMTNGSFCLPVNKTLFETCEVDGQCNGSLGLGICRTVGERKLCGCGPQYIEDMASLTCHKVGKDIFETCTLDAQCTRTKNADLCKYNTTTQANICSCRDGFEWVNASCVPIGRQLLESCEYDLQCNGTTNATVCGLFGNKSLCFCNRGMVEFHGTCIEAGKGLGEPCETDRQCTETLHAGVCGENSSCSCDSGFIREDNDCIRGGWNQDMIYQFMLFGAGGLLFGMFCLIGMIICKCRRNPLSKSGRFVVKTDQEPSNRQSILYAVPSDLGNHVGPSTPVHKETQRVANYSYNHLHEPVEQKKDNVYSEQDSCDDVYNHIHEKDAPFCEGVYDVTENVFNDMKHSSDDNSESVGLYEFAEPINANMY